jgi:hypothetical protein
LSRLEVSLSDFAKILDVSPSAVTRAISNGRLRKSVVIDGDKKRIVVYDGCLEWRDTKQHSKDRGNGVQAATDLPEDIMPVELSVSIDRHYTALMKKVEFLRETGELTSADKFRQEAFMAARAARDAILNVPVTTNREIYGVIVRLLSSPPSTANDVQKAAEAAATECRQLLKKAMTKALQGLANYLLNPESETCDSES